MPEIPQQMRTDRTKPLSREAAFSLESVNKEARTLELSFSSEAPVQRFDWWSGESYLEYLSHNEGEMDLERLNTVGVVGYNHDVRWELPIGSVERAWLDPETRKCRAVLRFDTDERAETIWQKIQSGTLRGVSFMYSVGVWEEVKAGKTSTCGRFQGPCYVGRQWEPYEVGPVAIPADPSVGAGRSAEVPDPKTVSADSSRTDISPTPERSDIPMPEENIVNEAAIKEAKAAEKARVSEISALCRQFDVDPQPHIDGDASVENVRKAILEKMASERKTPDVTVVRDESDKFRAAVIDGLSARVGVAVDKPSEGAATFRYMPLLRLAEEALVRAGGSASGLTKMELVREAVSQSPDLASVYENIAHKKMTQGYTMAPTTFEPWTSKGNLSDFKAESRVQISEFEDLEAILPAQPYTVATMSDRKVSVSVGKFGRMFCMTWEDMVNDNLGALNAVPMKMGAAAKRLVNTTVYGLLNTNGNMPYDTTALFHANHGNLIASGGGAPSVTTLAATQALMRKQKGLKSKEPLNISPAYLICPVALEVVAAQIVGSVVDPAKSNSTFNPFNGRLQVISDPLLDATSAAVWYLAAAPGLVDTVEVAYLDGVEQPSLEKWTGKEVDGIMFKVRHVFGATVLDHKGLAKNPGQ